MYLPTDRQMAALCTCMGMNIITVLSSDALISQKHGTLVPAYYHTESKFIQLSNQAASRQSLLSLLWRTLANRDAGPDI